MHLGLKSLNQRRYKQKYPSIKLGRQERIINRIESLRNVMGMVIAIPVLRTFINLNNSIPIK